MLSKFARYDEDRDNFQTLRERNEQNFLHEKPTLTFEPEETVEEIYQQIQKSKLKQVDDKYAYEYNVMDQKQMNCDPFVRKLLKQHYTFIFEKIKGYTKTVSIPIGMKNVLKFQPSNHTKPEDEKFLKSLQLAIKQTKRLLPNFKIPHSTFEDVFENIESPNTSAGFTFPGLKKKAVMKETYLMARNMYHKIKWGRKIYQPPMKIGFRGHLSPKDQQKVRPIWVQPFEILVLEALFGRNVYEVLKQQGQPFHFGKQAMPRLNALLNTDIESNNLAAVTLDWSSFDANCPKWVVEIAFDLFEDLIDFQAMTIRGEKITQSEKCAQRTKRAFEWVRNVFLNTKLMLPNSKVYQLEGCIPSGSYFTQLIGSIINLVVTHTLYNIQDISVYDMRVLGDDSLSFLNTNQFQKINEQVLVDNAKYCFNFTLNVDKVKKATKREQLSFLGYKCEKSKFVREDDTWFKSALYTERPVETINKSISRIFALYLLGGCNSDIFSKFVQDYFISYGKSSFSVDLDSEMQRKIKYSYGGTVPKGTVDFKDFDHLLVPWYSSGKAVEIRIEQTLVGC